MLTDILLDPANRLLQGAAADFSMFGAQPVVTLGAEQVAAEGSGFITTALGSTDQNATVRDLPAMAKMSHTPEIDAGIGAVARAGAAEPLFHAAPLAAPAITHSDSAADMVSNANGSGSAIPVIVVPSPTEAPGGAAQDDAQPSVSLTAPTLDLPVSAPLPFDGFALGALSASLTGPVLAATDTIEDAVQGTIQAAFPAIDSAIEGVGATLDTVVAPLAQSLAGNVEALVADLGAESLPAIESTIGAVGDAIAAVVPDAIDIFAGNGPAAGVATLAGMVASADVFDLADTVTTDALDTGGSILDGLVLDGETVSPLLGDLDHHGGGLIDDLDHGLLGGL